MKLIRMHKERGRDMWGILGKDAMWFFGFSRRVSMVESVKHKTERNWPWVYKHDETWSDK